MAQVRLKPAAEIGLPPDKVDLKEDLEALRLAEPDGVIMWLGPTQAVQLRRLAEDTIQPVWFACAALGDSLVMNRLTGRDWTGTIWASFVELPDSDSPLMEAYRKAFDKYGAKGERWGPFYYTGFGLAEPLIGALRALGPDLSREGLIQRLEEIKGLKGSLGRITFGPKNRRGSREMFLVQARSGGRAEALSGWLEAE